MRDDLKKYFLITIILSLFSTSLFSSNIYIKVMSLKNQDSLFNLSFELGEYGYKMHVTENEAWYRIYTGPFADNSRAESALKIIKENISREAFITTLDFDDTGSRLKQRAKKPTVTKKPIPKTITKKINQTKVQVVQNDDASISLNTYAKKAAIKKEEKVVKPQEKTIVINKFIKKKKLTKKQKKQHAAHLRDKVKNKVNLYRDTRFFLGMSMGISKFDVSQEDQGGVIALDYHPKDGAITYGFEAGYYFNNNVFATANYQHTSLDNLYFDNVFASLNYQFTDMELASPYIGILGGYNIMTWSNSPVSSVVTQGNSSSFFTGFQFGNDMPLTKKISAYIFYRYMMIDNVTNITIAPATKKIYHSNEQNINIGMKYNF
ncbi:SPOR domain-containing protein [Sulfurimonas sp.]|nr:SPOR domain-containing protein [Sulfurimonas sp.]